jgi:G:T-mismatch repair DNA endonuclease (very short patch repair protein)
LKRDGWRVFEVWECDTRDAETLRARLEPLLRFLRPDTRAAAGY